MDANQELKVCPFCAETIKAAAKVCPFCRAPQKGFARWRPYFGVIVSSLVLLAFVSLAVAWLCADLLRPEGRRFAPYRADLVVARTSLERGPKKAELWLSGFITNTGYYPWRVQELEVRFLDRDGHLVDVCQAQVSERFVVQPHHESAFRIGLGTRAVTNSGILEQVRVQTATDGTRSDKRD